MAHTPLTLTNARVVTPSRVHEGWLRVEGGRVAALGTEDHVAGDTYDVGGGWVAPGLVDSHIHGGVGHGFPDADLEGARATIAFNRARGVRNSAGPASWPVSTWRDPSSPGPAAGRTTPTSCGIRTPPSSTVGWRRAGGTFA